MNVVFLARYILAIESKQDLEEYLLDLLDGSVPRNKKFIQELLTKWRPPERQIQVPENVQVSTICSIRDT